MHNWLRPQYRDQHNLNLGDRVKSDRGRLLCNKWLLWGWNVLNEWQLCLCLYLVDDI